MTTKKAGWSVALGALMMASLASASCADGRPTPWAMRRVTGAYTFPARDAEGKVIAEGKTVDAATLDAGRQSYVHYCYACHGMNGDGQGPSSHGYRPPPRDFRVGSFKFGAVRSGDLPNDDDFKRIVRGGLHGTAMLEWDVSEPELERIIQFIKTFPAPPCAPSPAGTGPSDTACAAELAKYPDTGKPNRWQETYTRGKKKGQPKPTGEPLAVTEDPWAGKTDEAVAKGKELYHLKAQCANCHPTYVTRKDFSDMAQAVEGKPKDSFRKNMYLSIVLAAKDNPYQVALMPPDFTLNPLRSIRADHEMADLYRLIASGVGGVMPAWIDGLKQREIWALAYYVKSLRDLTLPDNSKKLNAMRDSFETQPAVAPPPKEEPKPEPKEEAAGGADAKEGAKEAAGGADAKDAKIDEGKDANKAGGAKQPKKSDAAKDAAKQPDKKTPAPK